MALPAHVLQRLPPGVFRPGEGEAAARPPGLPLGVGEIDAVLPDRGLPRGAVVELAVSGGAALATQLALAACRSAQQASRQRGGESAWCAFVDPASTLHAPGVLRAGVALDRLLVVRPPLEALTRTALRLAESRALGVLVVDTVGVPGASLDVALAQWPRVIRRLALAVEGSSAVALLLTDTEARRPLPLPVAQRIELSRPALGQLTLQVVKDRGGRVAPPRTVAFGASSPTPLGVTASGGDATHGLRLIG